MDAVSSNTNNSDVRPDLQSPEVDTLLLDQHHCDYNNKHQTVVKMAEIESSNHNLIIIITTTLTPHTIQ
eukprot:6905716-Ditylum_brightwellii.AAC.1